MRVARALVTILSIAVAQSAAAQTAERALTPLEIAAACGPPTSLEIPADALRIAGAQDTVPRLIFNPADQLVISGGTSNDVQIGQQFFIRRPIYRDADRRHAAAVSTLGWLRVVAVNETTAIASLDHFCGAIFAGDYLVPYSAPALPANATEADAVTDLDFNTLSRIVGGPGLETTGAGGSLMVIDRGSEQGTEPGMRFAIYRDLHTAGMPLTAVGDGVVLSVGAATSVVRITRSRDAVIPGDYIVPGK
jgi:hypothetical protein